MIIALVGESGTGKSTIQNHICKYGFKQIVTYTTRKPRLTERDGVDYHFISNEEFDKNIGLFAETETYSGNRKYGSMKFDYECVEDQVVVLTPSGVREVKKNVPNVEIFVVYIKAPLNNRTIRYIKRCGKNFTVSDLSELYARAERDFGMFAGFEREADLVVNNIEGEKTISSLARNIVEKAKGGCL